MSDRIRPTADCSRTLALRELVGEDADYAFADPELIVGEPALDSRKARAGDVFFALAGSKADGLSFARDAVARGVVAVVAEAERPPWFDPSVSYVRVGNARRAVALAAARAFPKQPETIAAVTGTSGKTSVAAFTRQVWARLGHAAASLGTLGVVTPSGAVYGSLTTPDPIELQRTLHMLAKEGVTHLCLEASSHGLDRATISTTIRAWKPISTPRCGCSANCCRAAAGRRYGWIPPRAAMWRRSPPIMS
ncbi:MAG: UDP-N-acetylmuramyl-tripeptide synthetase [Xanthobacteraceae bacterium]|nr:UDP-N-acetylmuramyl-tripeptide synthetase [Xanthobacteraceae bacterium]